jgi:hypothetical protein
MQTAHDEVCAVDVGCAATVRCFKADGPASNLQHATCPAHSPPCIHSLVSSPCPPCALVMYCYMWYLTWACLRPVWCMCPAYWPVSKAADGSEWTSIRLLAQAQRITQHQSSCDMCIQQHCLLPYHTASEAAETQQRTCIDKTLHMHKPAPRQNRWGVARQDAPSQRAC